MDGLQYKKLRGIDGEDFTEPLERLNADEVKLAENNGGFLYQWRRVSDIVKDESVPYYYDMFVERYRMNMVYEKE